MRFQLPIKFREEWFLFLSPAFIAVHGFVRFPAAIHWREITWLFLEYSFWSFLFTFLFSWLLGFRKAALFVFTLVLFNALFGAAYEPLIKNFDASFFVRFSFILPAVILLFSFFFLFLRHTKQGFEKAAHFLNLLFLVLMASEVLMFLGDRAMDAKQTVFTSPCTHCSKPDVYLLVTDGYAGKEQLSNYFHFDNSAFYDSLRSLGFHSIDSSFSNYSSTNQAMASLLNMTYLVRSPEDAHLLTNENNVTAFFKKAGYRIKNHSIFKLDEQFPKQPTGYFKTGIGLIRNHTFVAYLETVFQNTLTNQQVTSAVNRMNRAIQKRVKSESLRDSLTLQALLQEVTTEEVEPKFVYTHFMMPHPPYLFKENGQRADTSATPESQYLSYLQYSNRQLMKAVKGILQHSPQPPLIVLVSDHGYRNDNLPHPTPWRFSNLAAVYLPKSDTGDFYKGLSNVNLFRVILNAQFQQKLSLLKDSTCY